MTDASPSHEPGLDPATAPRPRVLTILSVCTGLYGGLSAMVLMGRTLMRGLALGEIEASAMDTKAYEQIKPAVEALAKAELESSNLISGVLALNAVAAGLALVAAWGLLLRKRFAGRTVGTAFGVCALLSNLASAVVLPIEVGGGIDAPTIVVFVFASWLIAMLNGRLRPVLVR